MQCSTKDVMPWEHLEMARDEHSSTAASPTCCESATLAKEAFLGLLGLGP